MNSKSFGDKCRLFRRLLREIWMIILHTTQQTLKKKKSPFKHLCSFPEVRFLTQASYPNILSPLLVVSPATQRHLLWGSPSLEDRETRGQIIFSLITFRMLINGKCCFLLVSKNKCDCSIPTAPGRPQPAGLIQVTSCGRGCAGAHSH